MHLTAAAFGEPTGQGWSQVGLLVIAFALSSVVGLERQLRGKSAGLRTQTIVGTAAALVVLVSKYGFSDVLSPGRVIVDPSRVAAQIVSGIGFLGAGLIITRRGAVHGLTTAAAVWETAAIGMAAGAGLPLLAVAVTVLHFVVVLGYTPLTHILPDGRKQHINLRIVYRPEQGVLRTLLDACTTRGWSVLDLSVGGEGPEPLRGDRTQANDVVVTMTLSGHQVGSAPAVLAATPGVRHVFRFDDDTE